MLNPFDFFDVIYCINLDSRADRWAQSYEQFQQLGIANRVIRMAGKLVTEFADPKRNACYGNALSHAACMERSLSLNYQNCLIFEDDVEFFHTPELTLDYLWRVWDELPHEWDMLYLGANMDRYDAKQISPHLARLTGCFSTHAYAVRWPVMKTLMDVNRNKEIIHNDVYYAENIIPKHLAYITIPLLAGQASSYSDIEGRIMSSNKMFLERFEQKLVRKDGL